MSVFKDPHADPKAPWYYVIELGTPAGRRQRRKKRGFRTRREAERAEALEVASRARGEYIEASPETIGELLDRWLTTVARHKVRATTYVGYEATIRVHLKPHLGSLRVQHLTAARVQAFYSARLDAGVGARTITLAHLRLRQALAMAEREGVVRRNVCDLVDPPTTTPAPGQSWTEDEARRFLAVASKHALHPLWALALATGLRRGELLGLRWQDIDLATGQLDVRQSIVILRGAPVVAEPKTAASKRRMRLPPDVVEALRAHRAAWLSQQLAARTWAEGDLVFCTREGKPLNPNNLYRYYRQIIAEAGVPPIRLHDARHTHGTILVAAGVSVRAVADRLGHSRTSVTLDTYAHVLPSMQDQAAEAIDKALFREKDPA